MTENPYGRYVLGEDVIKCLETTPAAIAAVVRGWSPAAFERRATEGTWSARELLVHLAHTEIVFGTRLRFALATDDFVVQPFDQDAWMRVEPGAEADDALALYLAARRLNAGVCRGLSPAALARPVVHPEYGRIDIAWIMATVAGHERHHLPQFSAIARAEPPR